MSITLRGLIKNKTTYQIHSLYKAKEMDYMETVETSIKSEVKNIFAHVQEAERITAFNEAWAKIINEQENSRDIYKTVSGI